MFNAEKLLGKVVQEVTGSSGMKKKKKKKKKKSSLIDNFTSGAGLLTAIGLGIGAYEILRDKSKQQTITGQPISSSPASVTPPPVAPPIPPAASPAASPPPPPPPPKGAGEPAPISGGVAVHADMEPEQLAIRLIQVMIASAHADGTMDAKEEEAVIGRLKDENFSQEEKMFLLGEMHNPKSIDELADGITDPAIAKTMYMLAATVIEIDTPEERQWLGNFAARLDISPAVQEFIEDQV